MSILTIISGVPLFSTQQEALNWAASQGLTGLHTHMYLNQVGYMGGVSHLIASTNPASQTPMTNTNTTSSSSNGGGSGY